MDISDFYPIHRSGTASYHRQIRYNEKSWNNPPFRASFQHKKEIPDLKLYQVWYLFWHNYYKLIQCTAYFSMHHLFSYSNPGTIGTERTNYTFTHHSVSPADSPHYGQFQRYAHNCPVFAAGCGYAYPLSGSQPDIRCSTRSTAVVPW